MLFFIKRPTAPTGHSSRTSFLVVGHGKPITILVSPLPCFPISSTLRFLPSLSSSSPSSPLLLPESCLRGSLLPVADEIPPHRRAPNLTAGLGYSCPLRKLLLPAVIPVTSSVSTADKAGKASALSVCLDLSRSPSPFRVWRSHPSCSFSGEIRQLLRLQSGDSSRLSTSPSAGVMSAVPIEPSKSAIGPDPSPGWSDLPTDVLIDILQRLELPGSVAFAAVCLSWRYTATAVGVPASRTPWLMCWAKPPEEKGVWPKPDLDDPRSCEFCSVLNPEKAYEARFPQGRFLCCCGASHGWLIASDELCNLALYNPFTSTTAPLPQITDFKSSKDLYDDEGNIVFYGGCNEYNIKSLRRWFHQKAILSCAPCAGSDCIAMVIIRGADWLAFARAGGGHWRLTSTIAKGSNDLYADCVYHNGRFYTVTMRGTVEMWDLDGLYELKKEMIVAWKQGTRDVRDVPPIVARHLVSTPWGDLLQIRVCVHRYHAYPENIRIQISKVDLEGHRKVRLMSATALRDHAVFVGLNHSACLPTKDFPELRPNCVYSTTSWLVEHEIFDWRHGWRGVCIFDLKNQTLERAFPSRARKYSTFPVPTEVWITPI